MVNTSSVKNKLFLYVCALYVLFVRSNIPIWKTIRATSVQIFYTTLFLRDKIIYSSKNKMMNIISPKYKPD